MTTRRQLITNALYAALGTVLAPVVGLKARRALETRTEPFRGIDWASGESYSAMTVAKPGTVYYSWILPETENAGLYELNAYYMAKDGIWESRGGWWQPVTPIASTPAESG